MPARMSQGRCLRQQHQQLLMHVIKQTFPLSRIALFSFAVSSRQAGRLWLCSAPLLSHACFVWFLCIYLLKKLIFFRICPHLWVWRSVWRALECRNVSGSDSTCSVVDNIRVDYAVAAQSNTYKYIHIITSKCSKKSDALDFGGGWWIVLVFLERGLDYKVSFRRLI